MRKVFDDNTMLAPWNISRQTRRIRSGLQKPPCNWESKPVMKFSRDSARITTLSIVPQPYMVDTYTFVVSRKTS